MTGPKSPITRSSLLSYATFWWLTGTVIKGYRSVLGESDIFELPEHYKSGKVLPRFKKQWERELKRKGPEKASLARAFVMTCRKRLAITFIFATVFIAISVIGPVFFLRRLIDYTRRQDEKVQVGIGYAFALMIAEMMRSATIQMYWFSASRYGTLFRSLVIALVYEKSLELRDLGAYSVGELVNVCTNDSQRLFEAGIYSPFIYFAFVTGGTVMGLTTYLIGPAALVGCFIFFLTLPIQMAFGRGSGILRRKALQSTDRRVRLMNEILTCVKLIKMYAWELPFARQIEDIRRRERATLQLAGYLQSVTVALVPVLPALASVSTFLIQAYYGSGMSAEDVFAVVALFNVLRFSVAVLPMGVKARAEAQVGFQRLRNFLLVDDARIKLPSPEANDVAVEFADATLYWPAVVKKGEHAKSKQTHGDGNVSSADAKSNGKPADGVHGSSNDDAGDDNTDVCAQSTGRRVGEDYIVLRDINLSVKKGELIGICGAVGSGKSSLLSSLLGQLHIKKGRVAIGGSVAYVAQQAWIQSDTLANNILFEQERDEDFYERVLTACSLRHDITVLPAGEETEIGERGINLSGGQKQRINLARAVYADRDVYLLDDPLSAVDAHVGRSIFDKCIKGILEGRTILLVTHQLQYLPACDRVCFLENNRAAVGTHDELMKSNTSYRKTIEQHRRSQEEEEEEEQEAVVVDGDNDDSGEKKAKLEEATKSAADVQDQGEAAKDSGEDDEKEKKEKKKASGKLVEAEDVGQGGITLATYANYARAGGGVLLFLFILLLFGCAMFSKAYSDYYLGYWIRQGDGNSTTRGDRGDPSDNPDLDMHALVYGMTLVALLAFQGFKGFLFVRQTLAASSNLHKQVFERIIHAPMSFFDTTPTGRILNRFSRDLDEIDVRLPFVAEQFLQNSALLLITLCMIAYVFPWFLLALVPIAAFFFSVVHFFRPTQRQVKRLSSATRSPLVSQLSATLQGIHTIAAFEKKDAFLTKFFSTLDQHSKCFFFFHCSSRWFAFRLDYTTAMMILATSLLAVLLHGHVSPELAALAITYAMSMAGIFQYTTRLSAEVEARFTSVERIHRYGTETPQEVGFAVKTPGDLPKNWPAFGSIAFDRVKVSYRPGLPPVLRDVTLNIRPREKIGIVGRTGAGKSTIAMVLYRMMELTSGSISIDGVDIASVEASLLRSRLSIIPQDPVLFVGSIRYNLDPFEEHSDDDIWRALERAHVKAHVSSLSQGLHAPVVENGENFSVGERQLLCMARALLRHSTILVMDEATAAIDTQTDALIQETIREAFQECTVLTVAHRLNTILDSDRILVMDGGQVAEFASPAQLMSQPESHFASMLRTAGITVDPELIEQALQRERVQQQQQQEQEEMMYDGQGQLQEPEAGVKVWVL